MGRKSAATALNEMIEQAATTESKPIKNKLAKKGREFVSGMAKSIYSIGRPTTYTKKIANHICNEVASGKTLTRVSEQTGIALNCIYGWLEDHEDFMENYRRSRELWSKSIVDKLYDESEHIDPSEALAKKVRAQIVQWSAARYAPAQFADSKRIELKGQVDHRHVLELPNEQRRRIAEAWLVSSGQEETIVIPDETGRRSALVHEPGDLEAAGVSTVAEGQDRIIPGRAKVADPARRKAKGRKIKVKPNLGD